LTKKTAGQIEEIGGRIEQFVGKEVREKVMEDSNKAAASSDMKKVALRVKDAMDRLDASTDLAKREHIMLACGYNCIAINNWPMQSLFPLVAPLFTCAFLAESFLLNYLLSAVHNPVFTQ
jgi:hypothetical protein